MQLTYNTYTDIMLNSFNLMCIQCSTAFHPQVQDVTMEIQDLLQWLEYTDLKLSSTKTVWGMPDSASERLSAHLVMLRTVSVVIICANVIMFIILND